MIKFLKKYEYVFYIIMMSVFIGIPILIQLHIGIVYELAKKMTPGNHSDWIQFWGSYFGFIPTGLITFMVLKFQFNRQKKIDKDNFEEQLKKQKQEFVFEKEFEDLVLARTQAMEIWIESSEIIFICENVGLENINFIYKQVAEYHEIIKKTHNTLASWLEERMNANKNDTDFKDMECFAQDAGKNLSKVRECMQKKDIQATSEFAEKFKENYRQIKNILTKKKIATINKLIN